MNEEIKNSEEMKESATTNDHIRKPRKRKTHGKEKNPLFVVTKRGKVVEQADHFIDALVKKAGLEPVVKLVNHLLQMVVDQFKGAMAIEMLKVLLDQIVEILKQIDFKTREKLHTFE